MVEGGCYMGVEFEYLADKDVLVGTVSGTYVISNDTSGLARALAILKEHNCSRLLADYSEGEFVAEILPAYQRPRTLEELGADRSLKVATVYKELNELTRSTETFYRSAGWNVRDFTDYDAAMEWLVSE